ncbi:MAG: hypothetical protein ABMA14_05525 [Hyphomonadaceae bacterium]
MLSFKTWLIALAMISAAPAFAQLPNDEAAVRAVIADWYARVGKPEADMPWLVLAPGEIEAGPGYSVPADLHSESAALRGPWIIHELAAQAMQFAYDIDLLKVDPRFAKAMVWERAYFYASAAQKTYELGAGTLFVLEKQADGRWLILAHSANSEGIPPNKVTDPMPDLRALYYERCGTACNPVADAKKAAEW